MPASKRRWRHPEKRMEAAVRMRKGGLSLRQIGDRLGVSKDTIARDLAYYEEQEVSRLLSHLALSDPLNATGNETR